MRYVGALASAVLVCSVSFGCSPTQPTSTSQTSQTSQVPDSEEPGIGFGPSSSLGPAPKCGSFASPANPYPCCTNGGNCTWFAWYKAEQAWRDQLPGWHNPNGVILDVKGNIAPGKNATWIEYARQAGYPISETIPSIDTIGVFNIGPVGHVAWVTGLDCATQQVQVEQMACCELGTGCSPSTPAYSPSAPHPLSRALGFIYRKGATIPATSPFCGKLDDDFNSNSLDTSRWAIELPGNGDSANAVRVVNQRLELRVEPGQSPAGVSTRCGLQGDFDVQVDYALLTWAPGNQYGLRLGTNGGQFGIYRTGSESYIVFDGPRLVSRADTGDASGQFRLVQSGGSITGYYRRGGTWVALGSAGSITPTTHIVLDISAVSPVSTSALTVAFDNFKVNSGSVICQ